ncbi:MAG: hypothetical protein AB1714_22175 [Acidobacteriota bacterium]
MRNTGMHQLTLRLPERLFQSVKRLARRHRTSVNRLAQQGLRRIIEDELARKMSDAYEALGRSKHESDVNAYFKAQAEVVNRD